MSNTAAPDGSDEAEPGFFSVNRKNPLLMQGISHLLGGLLLGEVFLADAAQRADKIVRKILPLCAGGNPVIGIAKLLIVDISADFANIFHGVCSFP